ncbi:hypothetical protein FACS1894205_2220 [Alphaproteobacteria bacterium]|nr:hypothetical protein FACS1894205_2220 [Alphaproteobacteria bacterium]
MLSQNLREIAIAFFERGENGIRLNGKTCTKIGRYFLNLSDEAEALEMSMPEEAADDQR